MGAPDIGAPDIGAPDICAPDIGARRNQVLYNALLSHFRARIEAVIGELKAGKMLYEHSWKANFELLNALITIDVHATQASRDLYKGERYLGRVIGDWPHFSEFEF